MDTINTLLSFYTDLALVVGGLVSAIFGLLAALVGLGWGVRKFMEHGGYYEGITGEMLHDEDYSNFRSRGKFNEM